MLFLFFKLLKLTLCFWDSFLEHVSHLHLPSWVVGRESQRLIGRRKRAQSKELYSFGQDKRPEVWCEVWLRCEFIDLCFFFPPCWVLDAGGTFRFLTVSLRSHEFSLAWKIKGQLWNSELILCRHHLPINLSGSTVGGWSFLFWI